MLLYLIRHGDPIYDPDTLTEKGKAQAEALAGRLSLHGLDRIYCSPNGRARETAEPTCRALGLEAQIEDWTSENHAFRDFSHKNADGKRVWTFGTRGTDMRNDETLYLGADWYNADFLRDIDARAGFERVVRASDEFLERQGYRREGSVYRVVRPNDDRVAVFAHGGFGLIWLSHLLALPPQLFWAGFGLTHSGITILRFPNTPDGLTVPFCLCFNDISHLYKEGLPVEHNNSIPL